jgi:uncharacterized protein YacL
MDLLSNSWVFQSDNNLKLYVSTCFWVENRPIYDLKKGLIGLVMMFFGIVFLFNVLCVFKGSFQSWVLGIILCIILIYFGLPLLIGLSW